MQFTSSTPRLYTSTPLPTDLPVPGALTPVDGLPEYMTDHGDMFMVDERQNITAASGHGAMYSDGTLTAAKVEGGFLQAVAAAHQLASTKHVPHTPGEGFAHGVFQAKDGSYYVSLLGDLEMTDSEELVTFRFSGDERIELFQPQLRAVVDEHRWVRFD